MKPVDIVAPNGAVHRPGATAATPARAAEPVRSVRHEDSEAGAADALVARTAGESAPVDMRRVDEIRRAIEDNRYPIIPARIGDAMIAAGYLLRVK